MKKHTKHMDALDHRQLELTKRLLKEISPFTMEDLPLDIHEEELFKDFYAFQRILGAGSFGVVIFAIEKAHLEHCAIKVFL